MEGPKWGGKGDFGMSWLITNSLFIFFFIFIFISTVLDEDEDEEDEEVSDTRFRLACAAESPISRA
jgi:hypothetical protein